MLITFLRNSTYRYDLTAVARHVGIDSPGTLRSQKLAGPARVPGRGPQVASAWSRDQGTDIAKCWTGSEQLAASCSTGWSARSRPVLPRKGPHLSSVI